MKTAKEFLINKDIKVNFKNLTNKSWDKVNASILEVMEEYAQYKVNELNKSDVIKSVCDHEKRYLAKKGIGVADWCPDCKRWV